MSVLSFALAFFCMLPTGLTAVAKGVCTTLTFTENIIASTASMQYWDIGTTLKPLMHMWYLGVLVQFYALFYLILVVSRLIGGEARNKNLFVSFMILGTIASFVLYLWPSFSSQEKFFLTPFRFYELGVGSLCFFVGEPKFKGLKIFTCAALVALVVLVALPIEFCGDSARRVAVVACSAALVALCKSSGECGFAALLRPEICVIGAASYSVFVWHQAILAFYRCLVGSEFGIGSYLTLVLLIGGFSAFSYLLLEKRLAKGVSIRIKTSGVTMGVIAASLIGLAFFVDSRSGIFRDYPELEVTMKDRDRVASGINVEYVDRIYDMDRDFEENGKTNVLIVGNSFARDWANVLLESKYADQINISYSFDWKEELTERIKKSDLVFYSSDVHRPKSDTPEYLWANVPDKKRVYCVGVKRFGDNNHVIFNRRFRSDYLRQRVFVNADFTQRNQYLREEWGDAYIDLIAAVQNEDGSVPVFTDDGKFISQDTRHLMPAGARYYAKILDLDKIFQQP